MSFRQYINRIDRLDALIRRKSTGTPKELAYKLEISERWLYKLLKELKEELDCPIVYDHRRQSYVYKEMGKIVFGFKKKTEKKWQKQVTGGYCDKVNSLYLFVQ